MSDDGKLWAFVGVGAAILTIIAAASSSESATPEIEETPYEEPLNTIKKLFEQKNYGPAVAEACKLLTQIVQDKSGIKDKDGTNLINAAFGDKGVLTFNVHPEHQNIDAHSGYFDLCRGVFGAFRNPVNHAMIKMSKEEAHIQINLIAYLAEIIEKHTIERNKNVS